MRPSSPIRLLASLPCLFAAAACAPVAVPLAANATPLAYGIAPYRGPTATPLPSVPEAPDARAPGSGFAAADSETDAPATGGSGACVNDLIYMGDLTYPDRTIVAPGERMEKKWKVRNAGTCDWGADYRLTFSGGINLGGRDSLALFPARAGSEATLVAVFTAPAVPGEYISRWQAAAPDGSPFGQILFIDVIVRQ